MEAFIGGLPQSIDGNVTASKPQTLEEATNIDPRLMDQILKRDYVQETNDHKRKFDDIRNTTSNNNNYPNNHNHNNYPNNRNNNNHSNNNNNYLDNRNNDNRNHQQQNGRQETFKANGNLGYNRPNPFCRKFGNEQIIKVVSSGWSFVSAILGQMTYSALLLIMNSGLCDGFLNEFLVGPVILLDIALAIVCKACAFRVVEMPFSNHVAGWQLKLWQCFDVDVFWEDSITPQITPGYGMIHNDGDGDNDANDGDDDEREISWK
ncbi:hypothetical protein Tco_0489135 [Tanacetum coccineum]